MKENILYYLILIAAIGATFSYVYPTHQTIEIRCEHTGLNVHHTGRVTHDIHSY